MLRAIALLSICCVTLSMATTASGQSVYRDPAFPPPMANTDGVIVIGGASAGVISTTEYFDHYHSLYQRVYPGAQLVARQAPPAPPPAALQVSAPPPITAPPETGTGPETAQDEVPVPVAESWSFKLTPFLWLPSIDANIGPGAVPTDMDATADGDSGIFGFDFGFLLMAEARRGRFGVLGDIGFISLSTDGDSPGTSFFDVEIGTNGTVGTLGAFYTAAIWHWLSVDTIIGIRYWSIGLDLDFSAGDLDPISVALSRDWVDPIIGLRLGSNLGGGFFVVAYGDVGGFGISSDITWQAYAALGYQFADWFTAELGYRYLYVEQTIGGVPIDLAMYAPLIAVTFIF